MMEKEIALIDYLNIIWKHKKFIIISVLAISIVTAGITMVLPKWYRATAVIMPPEKNSSVLSNLGTDLPTFGFLGRFGGDQNQVKLLAIMKSRSLLEAMNNKYNYQKRYDLENKQQTYAALRNNITVSVEDEMQISFSIKDKEQDLVAKMANYAIYCADSININLSTQKAKSNRKFLQQRLRIVNDSLLYYEARVCDFMKKYGIKSLEEQLIVEVKKAADMKADIMEKEARIDVMKTSLNPSNQLLINSEIALKSIKNKYNEFFDYSNLDSLFINLGNVPKIKKEYSQLQRKVIYFTKLLEYLAPQYEKAKIQEKKDVETVQILDKAIRPEKRCSPKRKIITLLSLVISSFLIIAGVLLHEKYL
ncbi:MAG: Wzz/FepE/Etk N-terminal domain-containing protein [Candidatus Krumholzibacteriota bacterium]|nr:Wzz/FepE/Etk N-terminal domain-containing protein [Candidatus Krumholzibacteriota bacterium]